MLCTSGYRQTTLETAASGYWIQCMNKEKTGLVTSLLKGANYGYIKEPERALEKQIMS